MIVISTYNPDTPRTTNDESLLTTMLASLVRHRVRCAGFKLLAEDEIKKADFQEQVINCDRLIGLVYPLLGLTMTEVYEVLEEERKKWQTDPTGNK